MVKTYPSGDNDSRFTPYDIERILRVEETKPELVSRVINSTYETKDGKIMPLYNANELYYITLLHFHHGTVHITRCLLVWPLA